MKRAFLFIALLAAAVVAHAGTVIEEVVARVNNTVITRSEFNRSREQLLNEIKQSPDVDATRAAEAEKNILRDLIDLQLLVQKAADLGYTADTEVIKRLDEMRKNMNLETMEELEKAASQQGINFEDFKENMRQQILRQMVISREVGGSIDITNEEIRDYYEKNKDKLNQPETVRLSEILVSTQKKDEEGKTVDGSAEEVAAAEARAKELLAQLKRGAKFEELAEKNSQGPTAGQGGDLGYFKRGALAKELEDQAFAMKEGELTDVIRTKQGFIILKVTEHHDGGVPALKDAERRIQEALYYDKLQPALRAYLTKLREDAYIDVKQGYVDSGASANQTKPVMTAAAPENEKKKK